MVFDTSPLLLWVWSLKALLWAQVGRLLEMQNLDPTQDRIYIFTRSPDDSFISLRREALILAFYLFSGPRSAQIRKAFSHRTGAAFFYFPTCQSFPWLSWRGWSPKVTLHFNSFQEFFTNTTGVEGWIPALLFNRATFTELLTDTLTRYWCYTFSE